MTTIYSIDLSILNEKQKKALIDTFYTDEEMERMNMGYDYRFIIFSHETLDKRVTLNKNRRSLVNQLSTFSIEINPEIVLDYLKYLKIDVPISKYLEEKIWKKL